MVVLSLQGCTSKVEIPIGQVAVVKYHEQVKTQVLKSGEYLMDFGSEVIIYDISSAKVDTEFGFMFLDTSEGNLKVAIEFNPIVDSLASFYKKYQAEYITIVVEIVTRKALRKLLSNYNPGDLTKEELEQKIIKEIAENPAIINYVNLSHIEIIELRF